MSYTSSSQQFKPLEMIKQFENIDLNEKLKEGFQKHPVLMTVGCVAAGSIAGWILIRRPQILFKQLPKLWATQSTLMALASALRK